jgi:hypothetical protein
MPLHQTGAFLLKQKRNDSRLVAELGQMDPCGCAGALAPRICTPQSLSNFFALTSSSAYAVVKPLWQISDDLFAIIVYPEFITTFWCMVER